MGFPYDSAGKESACNAGDLGSIPGLGRFPGKGKGYPLQYSGLENSMDCIVYGVAKSQTWLSDFHFHIAILGNNGSERIDLPKDTQQAPLARNSLVVQWLRLHGSTARGMGSIPGWGTKLSHARQCSQKKRKRERKKREKICLQCFKIGNVVLIWLKKKKKTFLL